MPKQALSLSPVIKVSDFDRTRDFYLKAGCKEVIITAELSSFEFSENVSFYLQRGENRAVSQTCTFIL